MRAPPDTLLWMQNALRGLEHRGAKVTLPGESYSGEQALEGEVTLKTFWVTEISSNKSGNAVVHVKLTRNSAVVSDKDYRGAKTVTNWSSGDSELQRLVDNVWADAIDKIAIELVGACSQAAAAANQHE